MGTLDSDAPLMERRVALKLGLQAPQLADVKRLLQAGKYTDAYGRARGALNASGVSHAHREELQALATQAWQGMAQSAQ